MRSLNVKSKLSDYNVIFYSNIEMIEKQMSGSIVIVDQNVYNLYRTHFKDDAIVFECTEDNKTLEGSMQLFRELIKRKAKSNSKVFAVGGGILQDVVGFACSTYCRGIEYDLVPTTLLSQCDSCIGGKTSINFEKVKNILGTFYPPNNIHICTEFLNTLTKEDYLSGMGEIIKFNILKDTTQNIIDRQDIINLIIDSLSYKSSIIEVDEFDKRERKFLNFGHTFGHALESTSKYKIPHGTAVLFGILVANKVSTLLGLLTMGKESDLFDLIFPYIKHQELQDSWFDFYNLLSVIKHDKKNTGTINMVLITNKEPRIVPIESEALLKQALNNTYASIRLRNKIS